MHFTHSVQALAAFLCLSRHVTASTASSSSQRTSKFLLGAWEAYHKDHPEGLVKRQQDNAYCVDDQLLEYLESAATNTAQCSSYLDIAAMTTTTTVFPTTWVFFVSFDGMAEANRIYSTTVTMRAPITRSHNAVVVSTVYVTTTTTAAPPMHKVKRTLEATARAVLQARQYTNATANSTTASPDNLGAFSSALSSGCSCLDIPVATTTLTSSASPYVNPLPSHLYSETDTYRSSPILHNHMLIPPRHRVVSRLSLLLLRLQWQLQTRPPRVPARLQHQVLCAPR